MLSHFYNVWQITTLYAYDTRLKYYVFVDNHFKVLNFVLVCVRIQGSLTRIFNNFNKSLPRTHRYLTEVLLNWQLQTLNRAGAQLHLEETICEQNEEARKTRSSNKKAKRNKNKKQTTIRQHAHEITTTQVCIRCKLTDLSKVAFNEIKSYCFSVQRIDSLIVIG